MQLFKSHEQHSVKVDSSNSGELKVTFDITFPHAPCAALHPDIMDFSGLRNVNAKLDFKKMRLDANGKEIGLDTIFFETLSQDFLDDSCKSCFGAGSTDSCCNSCVDLETAYKNAGMDFESIFKKAPQCRQRYYLRTVMEQQGEGCRISGSVIGHKFPGNLHFAPGMAIEKSSYHGHVVEGLEKLSNFNMSHRINTFYFGDRNPNIKSSLEQEEKQVSENGYLFSYHLRLVNSITMEREKPKYNSFEYSTTQNTTQVNVAQALSGIFFHYEISPMLIEHSLRKKISLTGFLINFCSIIGGVFALSSIIDAILFRFELRLAQKRSLGKSI